MIMHAEPSSRGHSDVTMVDHCCSVCRGGVLRRVDGSVVTFICNTCRREGTDEVTSICFCGARGKGHNRWALKCIKNPEPSPEFPAHVVPGII